MMNYLSVYVSFIFFMVVVYFFLESSNFLNMVLLLELISMTLYFCLYIYFFNSFCVFLYFLVMSVCEGSVSLSLVIMMVRTYGDVMLKSLNLTLC